MSFRAKTALFIATMGGIGRFPKMPGTMGTLASIPLIWLMWQMPAITNLICLLLLGIFGVWAAEQAGRIYHQADDPRIVIDELLGFWVALLPFQILYPMHWQLLIAGFGLFRLMDIAKPFPVCWADRTFKSGVGVVLDDVLAGIYVWAPLYMGWRFFA